MAENVIYLEKKEATRALQSLRDQLTKDPNNIIAAKNAGIILHQKSRKKPTQENIIEAERYLKKANRANKTDAETLAWLGSVTTMKAQFEKDPGRQTFFVKSGTNKLDKAVLMEPDNKVIRLTRAYNSLEIPPFLGRTRFAIVDFEHYFKLCELSACADFELNAAREGNKLAKQIIANNR